jgi:hypothetical protein
VSEGQLNYRVDHTRVALEQIRSIAARARAAGVSLRIAPAEWISPQPLQRLFQDLRELQ